MRWIVLSAAALIGLGTFSAWGVWRWRGAGANSPAPHPPAGFIAPPASPVLDIPRSEAFSDRVGKSLKSGFLKGLREIDRAKVCAAVTPDFLGRFPGRDDGREVPDGSFVIREFPAMAGPDLKVDALFDAVTSHLQGVSTVERTTWRPYEFLLEPDEKRATAKVHFQLAGPRPDGTRLDLVASIEIEAIADGDGWKLRRLDWIEGTRIEGRFQPWKDITDVTGFTANDSAATTQLVAELANYRNNSMYGGLCVADFNRDGYWDILASRFASWSRMYLNDGRGGFVLGDGPRMVREESPTSWLYVDLDNDGQEELVGTRVLEYTEDGGALTVWRRGTGGWEALPRTFVYKDPRHHRQVSVMGVLPADLDGNGFLDLFFCCYSNENSLTQNFNSVASYDGNDNWLFLNQGGLKFTEESEERGIFGTQYTFCGKIWDLDFDGDLDIYECNDYGPNVAWINDGKAQFKPAKGFGLDEGSNYTMGVSIADYDNTGDWAIYISNMYSHAGNRIVPLARGISPELVGVAMVLAKGNQMYAWDAKGRRWHECAVGRGVNQADWAWACVFTDCDNDMDKDIFVANGFTSNTDAAAPDY
jgi:hypothetical protein